jgi:hypothetical protein
MGAEWVVAAAEVVMAMKWFVWSEEKEVGPASAKPHREEACGLR